MNVNRHLSNRLKGIQQALIAQYNAGKNMPSSTAGSERETFIREYLQKLFPAHYRFSTGAITDSDGSISGQVDIVIEYPYIPSFPTPNTKERLFLAESVAIAMEIKSDLNKQWSEIESTFAKIKLLNRKMISVTLPCTGPAPGPKIPCIAVGYTGHKTINGLEKRILETSDDRRPDGVLVIDSGVFYSLSIKASGPFGLYGLCVAITSIIFPVAAMYPNLNIYMQK